MEDGRLGMKWNQAVFSYPTPEFEISRSDLTNYIRTQTNHKEGEVCQSNGDKQSPQPTSTLFLVWAVAISTRGNNIINM